MLALMPKQVDLLTKELAAEQLGMSVRRIMELSAEGKPKRHRATDPATRREAVMFAADEIKRMREEAAGAPVPNTLARVARRLGIEAPAASAEAAAPAEFSDGRSPDQRWITIDEAVEYIGLPASAIRQLIESGRLRAIDVGVRPGGHLRVSWRDLNAIEGDDHGRRPGGA